MRVTERIKRLEQRSSTPDVPLLLELQDTGGYLVHACGHPLDGKCIASPEAIEDLPGNATIIVDDV